MKIEIAVFCALGLLVGILLFVWVMTQVRYRIGSRHVKVLLFGVCIRRIALGSIESISKRRGTGWAEHWWSTTKPKHRMLVLRRKRGLFRNFVLTPKNRYVFKTDLERAMRRVGAPLEPASEPIDQAPPGPESSSEALQSAERMRPEPAKKAESA